MTNPFPGAPNDPYGFLEQQRARLAGVRERAQLAQAELADNVATARSGDGTVELTVNAGGQLASLHLGAKAQGRSPIQLAEAIMATYRTACAQAAARTLNIVSDLAGEDSISVSSMKATLPGDIAESVAEIRREEGRVR